MSKDCWDKVSSTLEYAKKAISNPEVLKLVTQFTASEIEIMLESDDEFEFAKKNLKKALNYLRG